MKQFMNRQLVLLLTGFISVSGTLSLGMLSYAKTEKEIVRFEELPDETLSQEVVCGTKKKELDLPKYLYAQVEDMTESEDDDSEIWIASSSDASSVSTVSATSSNAQSRAASKATPANATPSDADWTDDWKRVRVNWVLDESFSEGDEYDETVPGVYVFEAELAREKYVLGDAELPRIEVVVTAPDCTEIYTVEDLKGISDDLSGTYKLMNDLDLSDEDWTPIEDFHGVFDGGNHRINNLTMYCDDEGPVYLGLFSHDSHAEFKNLVIHNVTCHVAGEVYIGCISSGPDESDSDGSSVFDHCRLTGDCIIHAEGQVSFGGIASGDGKDISDCRSTANVEITSLGTEQAGTSGVVAFDIFK
ncbi:MAG: hypothetical protein LUE86_07255 [Clostridiales bacterium]|nr:hypothetical protein [Clostridiales bacterium]